MTGSAKAAVGLACLLSLAACGGGGGGADDGPTTQVGNFLAADAAQVTALNDIIAAYTHQPLGESITTTRLADEVGYSVTTVGDVAPGITAIT